MLTMLNGGAHWATWPATATATYDVTFLPQETDAEGYGSRVRAEIEAQVEAACRLDDWLAGHPPRLEWLVDFPPIPGPTR